MERRMLFKLIAGGAVASQLPKPVADGVGPLAFTGSQLHEPVRDCILVIDGRDLSSYVRSIWVGQRRDSEGGFPGLKHATMNVELLGDDVDERGSVIQRALSPMLKGKPVHATWGHQPTGPYCEANLHITNVTRSGVIGDVRRTFFEATITGPVRETT